MDKLINDKLVKEENLLNREKEASGCKKGEWN